VHFGLWYMGKKTLSFIRLYSDHIVIYVPAMLLTYGAWLENADASSRVFMKTAYI
jgi:hypothetical protein